MRQWKFLGSDKEKSKVILNIIKMHLIQDSWDLELEKQLVSSAIQPYHFSNNKTLRPSQRGNSILSSASGKARTR